MKSFQLFPAVLVAMGIGLPLRADDALPKPQPAGRYEPMAMRSPFTAPTIAPPAPTPTPAPPGPHWWDQMSVTSLMEVGGSYFAAVVDKANGKHYVLERNKADEESGLLLTEVQWNEHSDQSTVTVRKGTDTAPPLRFDSSATAVAAPTGISQPFNPAVRQPGGLSNPTLPPGFSGTPPPPPPSVPNVVRRNSPIASRPGGQPNPATVNQPAPNPPEIRKIRPLGDAGE